MGAVWFNTSKALEAIGYDVGHKACKGCDCAHRVGEGNRVRSEATPKR